MVNLGKSIVHAHEVTTVVPNPSKQVALKFCLLWASLLFTLFWFKAGRRQVCLGLCPLSKSKWKVISMAGKPTCTCTCPRWQNDPFLSPEIGIFLGQCNRQWSEHCTCTVFNHKPSIYIHSRGLTSAIYSLYLSCHSITFYERFCTI